MTEVAAIHRTPRSTTRRALRRLLGALLAVTAIAGAATLWAFSEVRDTAEAMRTRRAPAILQLAVVHDALVQADSIAIASFSAEQQLTSPRLAGPGEEFQNQIAIASQGLTQIAGENTVGEAGNRTLQLVQGLLVTYTALIGQADAHWQSNGKALGTTELWNASRLLHGPDGILRQLDGLLDAQKAALNSQVTASWMTWPVNVALIALNLALGVLLAIACTTLRRRFQRMVNLGLAVAVVLLFVGFGAIYWIVDTQNHVQDSRDALYRLVADRRTHSSIVDSRGQGQLATLLGLSCRSENCGDTVAGFLADVRADPAAREDIPEGRLTDETKRVNALIDAAGGGGALRLSVYPLPIAIGVAIFLGIRPRLVEYRYQPR
jgi:hypothetical protein